MLVAALVAATPGAAMGERDTGGFGAFNLKASNGFELVVLANSRPGFRHGELLIWATGKEGFVSYLAPATVTDTKIEADLGPLASIDLEFQPSGETGYAAPICELDDKAPYEKGTYVGTFEFHGEEGYAEASATSLPLSLHPFIDFVCGGAGFGETFGDRNPGARLTAAARKLEARVSLQVNQNRRGARVKVGASIDEMRGKIRIGREITKTFPAATFHFDPALRTASLAPPVPFSGSAVFRRNAEEDNRWTGSLAVDFPGHSDVPLTGALFAAHLRHARLTESRFGRNRPSLLSWPSTKPLPTAFATPSLLVPR
jgi:hypothetical protein